MDTRADTKNPKIKCPTCTKYFVNLQEHITKIHTKIHISVSKSGLGDFTYMGHELKRSGSNASSDGIDRHVYEGWKKPKAGGYYHEFEIAYYPATKKVVSFTECLTNGKTKKLMTSNIILTFSNQI
jgi:hypothetical protein